MSFVDTEKLNIHVVKFLSLFLYGFFLLFHAKKDHPTIIIR